MADLFESDWVVMSDRNPQTAGAVSLGINGAVQWLFNSDKTVLNPSGGTSPWSSPIGSYTPGPMVAGGAYFGDYAPCVSGSPQAYISCQANAAAQAFGWGSFRVENCVSYTASVGCRVISTSNGIDTDRGQYTANFHSSGAPGSCPALTNYNGGSCTAAPNTPAVASPTSKSISSAVADLPQSELALAANPVLLAQAINNAWQQAAAQPAYQGLPYSMTDPVTVQDVQAWQASNPSAYPTVGDMLSPAINPTTGSVAHPIAPGTSAQAGTSSAPAGSTTVDLGVDPAIGSPTLQTPPTGNEIVDPVMSLLPGLKNFNVPGHASQCPRPVFDIPFLNWHVTMDQHCGLIEQVRPQLAAAMYLVWTLVALFIILSA